MFYQSYFFLIHLIFTVVIADVSISKPGAADTFSASNGVVKVPLTWIESNSAPKLDDIQEYTIVLCTGPNADINGLETLEKLKPSDIDGYSINLEIPATVGGNGLYFIQVYSTVKNNGHSINYSKRFTLTGMTGSVVASGSGDTPNAEVNLQNSQSTMNAAQRSSSFLVYYTSQTGLTRYAPMQTQPGTQVTATSWSRRYPTSSVSYYTSLRSDLLEQFSTVTPGWSYTISSAANYATPAAFPSENGGWYDASERLSRTVSKLSIAKPTSESSA